MLGVGQLPPAAQDGAHVALAARERLLHLLPRAHLRSARTPTSDSPTHDSTDRI